MGARHSQEHNDRIASAMRHKYQDDPDYELALSKAARDRWNGEFLAEVKAQLDDFEEQAEYRRVLAGIRYLEFLLREGGQLSADQRKFKNAIREVLDGDFISGLKENSQ